MRKAAISSSVIGLLLLVAAALTAWWITPSYIARMPGNYDKTRTYDATVPEMAGIALPNGRIIPVLPVLSFTYHASPASLSAAVNDANSGSSTITTWGVTVPITTAIVGFVLTVLAVFLWIRGTSRGRPTETAPTERHPAPVGGIS
jgi:uncharacterized membrane protein (DUF485 family)